MKKPLICFLIIGFALIIHSAGQEDYLKISAFIAPESIKQGEEGILTLIVVPKEGIRISSAPEFVIKFEENTNLTFSKYFFTASELDFETEQDNENVFLDLSKEISIPFKIKPNSLIGKQVIQGEIKFTAVFKDHWSLKTFQKFETNFRSRRNARLASKR